MSSDLTPLQSRFVEEYIIDLNGTKAAIRAGYSEASARTIASELLSKPHIQDAIADLMDKRTKRTEISADRVVKELAKIAFSDLRKFATWSCTSIDVKDSADLDDDDASCVLEVSDQVNQTGFRSIKVKLHDKVRALELLGKHTGAFNADHSEESLREFILNYKRPNKEEAK